MLTQFFGELSQWVLFKQGDFLNYIKPVKYLGQYYLKIVNGFKIRQDPAYVDRILAVVNMKNCKAVVTPGVLALRPQTSEEKASWLEYIGTDNHHLYR